MRFLKTYEEGSIKKDWEPLILIGNNYENVLK